MKRYRKNYRGLRIDRDLDEPLMDRLNAIPGIEVIGTCAGDPETDPGPSETGSTKPFFWFDVGAGHTAEEIAERLAEAIRSDDIDVETTYWGGQFGIDVTHRNAQPQLDEFSPEQIAAYPTRKVIVYVTSTIDNTGTNQAELNAWWAAAIERLESAVRLHMPAAGGSTGS